jgi:hypothetical protein
MRCLFVLNMSDDPCNISFFQEINERGTVKFDEKKIQISLWIEFIRKTGLLILRFSILSIKKNRSNPLPLST